MSVCESRRTQAAEHSEPAGVCVCVFGTHPNNKVQIFSSKKEAWKFMQYRIVFKSTRSVHWRALLPPFKETIAAYGFDLFLYH